jgi:hypothetical protein
MNKPFAYFETFDGGDLLRVEVIGTTGSPSGDLKDKLWLEVLITVKGCTFRGQYNAQFMRVDFYKFRKQLISLIYNLEKTAAFNSTEGYLEIEFDVEAGDYITKIIECDVPGIGGELRFGVSIEKPDMTILFTSLIIFLSCIQCLINL